MSYDGPFRRSSDLRVGELVRVVAMAALMALIVIGVFALVLWVNTASAAPAPGASPVIVPQDSFLHRTKLRREVVQRFGNEDTVARIAGQVHVESRWNPHAQSRYAEGMAQFTPATSRWLESVCPEIGTPDPWSPDWSLRAVVCYDHWLYARVDGATDCDRWAFTLSAYNGGLGWVARDQQRAAKAGADPHQWFGQVELHSPRAAWAQRENRGYVQRILRVAEPAYIAMGWPGTSVCL